jgi:hypothetical protein
MSGPHQVEIHEIGPHEITASVLERPDRGGEVRRYQTYQFLAVLGIEIKTIVIHHDVSHGDEKGTFSSALSAEQFENLVLKKLYRHTSTSICLLTGPSSSHSHLLPSSAREIQDRPLDKFEN